MTTLAQLVVKLTADVGDFDQKMTSSARTVDRVGRRATEVGQKLTTRLTLPLVALGGVAVDAASDLEESISKVNVVFEDSAGVVMDFADSSATALGISRQEALEATGTFGNLFRALEIGQEPAAEMSTELVRLAADLASFNNMDPTEVLEKLRSGIVGEVEPLRTLGVNLTMAAVQAEALEMGLADTTDALTQADLVTARYALIMEQTATAQGDFARTSEGLANQTRIAKAQLRDVAAEMGQHLLPIALDLANAVNSLLTRFANLSPPAQRTITVVGGLAAAAGPALLVTGKLITTVTTLTPAIAALPGVLTAAQAGLQLYAGGASLAEVASLGLSAALGPIVVVVGAVAAAFIAARKAIQLYNDVQEQNANLTEIWAGQLEEQTRAQADAAGVAEWYIQKQQEMNRAYEEGGIVADIFVDRQRAVNASTEDLQRSLVFASSSYDDYLAAVDRVNLESETRIAVLDRMVFNAMRNQAATEEMTAAEDDAAAIADDLAAAEQRVLDVTTQLPGSMNQVADAAQYAAERAEELARRQEEAWETFSGSVEGAVDRALEAYRSGNTEMLAEQERALAEMLWNQTDTMQAMGQITEDQALDMKGAIAAEYGIMVDETELTTSRILAMYQDWASGGETTEDEIIAFLNNIGVEAENLAAAEEAAIDQQITARENYRASVTLTADQIAAQQQAIAEGETWLGGVVVDETGRMADVVSGSVPTWRTSTTEMAMSMGGLRGSVEEDSAAIVGHLDAISQGIYRMPSEKVIDIRIRENIPEAYEFNSPQFRFQTALEELVDYAGSHQVRINTVDGAQAGGVSAAGAVVNNRGGDRYEEMNLNLYADRVRESDVVAAYETIQAMRPS